MTDSELIARILLGERQLYAQLVNRYGKFVFTLAIRYVPVREDAE